jgi:thiosulfate/3-mercaptopyruvate sulfurtransferase
LTDVRILDGGLSGWTAAGGDLQTGPVQVPGGDVAVYHPDLYTGARPTLTAADVEASRVDTLLDARAGERFRGEVEPVDPVAGHIPGAGNLPSTSMLDADGRFLPPADLAALVQGLDLASAGVYCGSGVTASVVVAGLSALGVDAALFPGSWSQWSGEGRRAQQGN